MQHVLYGILRYGERKHFHGGAIQGEVSTAAREREEIDIDNINID